MAPAGRSGPRVLLVKTSSLGDVLHALYPLTEARAAHPGLQVDWLVEEAFAEIPAWHPSVRVVLPLGLRRWRREWPRRWPLREPAALVRRLRHERYDLVLDAQGLIKSALFTRLARGPRAGFDRHSAREPLAARCYQRRIAVPRGRHAVQRLRALFAAALDYPLAEQPPDSGIDHGRLPANPVHGAYIVALHGTTWPSKHWPLEQWRALCQRATAAGLRVLLPAGNECERRVARALAQTGAEPLPPLGLGQLAAVLAGARAAVAVDTGPAHLAAAVGTPVLALHGSTDARLTGTGGARDLHLQAERACAPCLARRCRYLPDGTGDAPCYESLPAQRVWQALQPLLAA